MYVCMYMYVCTYVNMHVCTYVRTYVCVSCDSYNKYLLFPHTIFNDFPLMCKDYVLCAVETEVCRLFVVAETHKFTRTNISKYFSPI